MSRFETTRRVMHSPENMFDLVADVEAYPKFVPLCQSLLVRGRKPLKSGDEVLIADMRVAYKVLNETFTTKVTLERSANRILVEYLDGPFDHLQNIWDFKVAEGGGTDIRFFIDYKFKSRAFEILVGAMFERAFRKFSQAFEERADIVYGKSVLTSS